MNSQISVTISCIPQIQSHQIKDCPVGALALDGHVHEETSSSITDVSEFGPVHPLLQPAILRSVFFALRDEPLGLMKAAHCCRLWFQVLCGMPEIWSHVSDTWIVPTFPAWESYSKEFRQTRVYALAIMNFFLPKCCMCGASTYWYLAIIGARICRTCFHKPSSPVELCSIQYASQLFDVPIERLKALPHVRVTSGTLVGLQTPEEAILVLKAHCQKHACPDRDISKAPRNLVGECQVLNQFSQLHILSYHPALPLKDAFDRKSLQIHVYSEAQLRAAVQPQEYRRFSRDSLISVKIHGSIQVYGPIEVSLPAKISGYDSNACLWTAGARGVLIAGPFLEIADLSIFQVNVRPNHYMCTLQVDTNGTLKVSNCSVRSSGSAVRGLRGSRTFVLNSSLQGIAAICLDEEKSMSQCKNNKLTYFGEWAIQIVSNPGENPAKDYSANNVVEHDPTIMGQIFN